MVDKHTHVHIHRKIDLHNMDTQENTLGCKHSPNGDPSPGETAPLGLWG